MRPNIQSSAPALAQNDANFSNMFTGLAVIAGVAVGIVALLALCYGIGQCVKLCCSHDEPTERSPLLTF